LVHDLAEEKARCQAGIMAETRVGYVLLSFLVLAGASAFVLRARLARQQRPADALQRYDAITAAVLAYLCYAASALQVQVPLPGFFREHLFDGFAPAALVGYLVTRFSSERARTAAQQFRPASLILLSVSGLLVFALIAAAAVFASGSNEFLWPVVTSALTGGSVFLYAYVGSALTDATPAADVFRDPERRSAAQRPPAVRLASGGNVPDAAPRAVNQAASEEERGGDPGNQRRPGAQ
jgi:peptidoglycan/LPS O-acetylase OafA/YrhL